MRLSGRMVIFNMQWNWSEFLNGPSDCMQCKLRITLSPHALGKVKRKAAMVVSGIYRRVGCNNAGTAVFAFQLIALTLLLL